MKLQKLLIGGVLTCAFFFKNANDINLNQLLSQFNALYELFFSIFQHEIFDTLITIAKYALLFWTIKKLYEIAFEPLIVCRFADVTKWIEDGHYQPNASPLNSKSVRVRGKIPHPYPNGWFKVTESHKLKKGDVQYHQLLGQHLVLFRTESGEARILDAYCPHLGANLGITGKVCGNCIECPFHGWKFDGESGKCESIPYSDSKIPEQAHTKAWKVDETNGGIFVYHNLDGESPSWSVPPFPQINNGEWTFLGKFEHIVEAHVQEIPENGPDLAHLHFLHTPFYIEFLNKALCQKWSSSWTTGEGSEAHVTTINLHHDMMLFGYPIPLTNVTSRIIQLGPAIVRLELLSPIGHFVVWQSVTPVAPLQQKVSHVMYGPKDPLRQIAGKIMLFGFHLQFTRDIVVWNNKTYSAKPLLVKNDGPIMQFRRWYSRFYPKQPWDENAGSPPNEQHQSCAHAKLDW